MRDLSPSAASASGFQKDPAQQIAVTLFTTLATVSGIAAVLGMPFWVNKLGTTVIFVLLTVAALWARTRALRGGHLVAMHGFAMVAALIAFPLMALSVHLTAPTLIMATILPAYAAICGRNYALGLGAGYIVAAIAVLLAPMAGISIPKPFPTPPVAEIATAAIAIVGIIGPLSLVFDRMREAVRALDAENQQRKEAESALEQHRHNLEQLVESRTSELRATSGEQQAILDSANSGIVLLKDRVIVSGNRKLHEMFGWPIGEMVGKPSAIWYPDEAANAAGGGAVYEQIWRGQMNRREQELMRRDGSRFWARLTGTALDVADQSKGMVGIIEDISIERATMEQMRHAKALAEETTQMKSDFLANMSHEIRTPMNAVIGMSHLLLRTELTARQRDYLAKIQGAGQHLVGIIIVVLDFSKVEAG